MLHIRNYESRDWESLKQIHDSARMQELELAGLKDAFLPLEIAAEREGLLEYPGLFVAEDDGTVVGFAACTEEELAWLYVSPEKMRHGVGTRLAAYALKMYPDIQYIEVLKGNLPALQLYEKLGFTVKTLEEGKMPGNESFSVQAYLLEREEAVH